MANAPRGIEIIATAKTDSFRVLYNARQVELNRPLLLVGLAPGVLSTSPVCHQLEAEAKVLAELDHPNILRLYDFLREGEGVWLVLEDVSGPTLKQLMEQPISWQALSAIGLDLCRALSHAHRLGHYHGSLTADVVQFSKTGRTKLAGFGRNALQEKDSIELLDTESRGGLAPETSIGQAHSAFSDIFALGSLLYTLASGRTPFGDINDSHYPSNVRNEAHEPLIKLAPHLPHALRTLIEQMLEKLPAHRPATAESIAEQLRALVGGNTLAIVRQELVRLGHVPAHLAGEMPLFLPVEQKEKRTWSQPALVLTAAVASAITAGFLVWLVFATSGPFAKIERDESGRLLDPRASLLRQSAKTSQQGDSQLDQKNQDLDLDPALHLRVVASPWAYVIVDGVQLETTPFAHPIALLPGSHVIRLEHPSAPAEERTISGQAGQVVLLNVQMHVKVELPASLPVGEVIESTP